MSHTTNSLQALTDFAKSAAATGLASKQGGNGIIGGKLGREVVVQLFKKWVRSDGRVKVQSVFRPHANEHSRPKHLEIQGWYGSEFPPAYYILEAGIIFVL